jgi:hypothetical protein
MSDVLVFRAGGREYSGTSALEIVRALKREAEASRNTGRSVRQFLRDSLEELGDSIPLRELDVSERLDEEMLALSYLYLRDEFGAGELSGVPGRQRWAHAL